MKKSALVLACLGMLATTTGCGDFFTSGSSGSGSGNSGGNANIVLMQVRAVGATNSNGAVDTSATSAYYTYGGFNLGGADLSSSSSVGQTGNDSAGAGNFGVPTPSTPSSSNSVGVGWAVPHDSACPAAQNPGNYVYLNASYTAYQQVNYLYCQAAPATHLSVPAATQDTFPNTLTMTTNYVVPTTYGTPQVGIYDSEGNFIDTADNVSVSSDGTSITFSTDNIPQPAPPDGDASSNGPVTRYALALVSINQDGSFNQQGGATFSTRWKAQACNRGSCSD